MVENSRKWRPRLEWLAKHGNSSWGDGRSRGGRKEVEVIDLPVIIETEVGGKWWQGAI